MSIAENERAKKAEQGLVDKNLELRPFSSKEAIDAISSFLRARKISPAELGPHRNQGKFYKFS
jgi:hypothetical protein